MVFPIEPMGSKLACVLQGQRTHLHMVTVGPKVKFQKKNGIFHDGTISFIKIYLGRGGIVLKQKWGGVENTAPPQPNCCCKKIYIVKKTITTYTLENLMKILRKKKHCKSKSNKRYLNLWILKIRCITVKGKG